MSDIETYDLKWLFVVERSINFLNYGALWLQEVWRFEFQHPLFKKVTLAGLNKKLLIPLPLKAIQNLTFQYETPCIFPLLYIGIRKVSNMKTIFILIEISVAYDPRKSFLLGVTIRER